MSKARARTSDRDVDNSKFGYAYEANPFPVVQLGPDLIRFQSPLCSGIIE